MTVATPRSFMVDPRKLRPHPENYQHHPREQIEHLAASIREHGFYRNVVVANDRATILAGHGAVVAAIEADAKRITATEVPYDPDSRQARKLIAADNEIARLAIRDEAKLALLLRDLADDDVVGTGFSAKDIADLRSLLEVAPEPEAPSEFPSIDPGNVRVQYHCPSCGYEWSGNPAPGS